MTTTTGASERTHTAPWPARRTREGSATGRHAAPDVTERMPAVPRGGFPARTVLPAPSRPMPVPPAPRAQAVVRRPTTPPLPIPAPRPAPAPQPMAAVPPMPPRPAPSRPVVGSGMVAATSTPVVHNGLGTAALCLGLIALPLGMLPVTGFMAAGLGVLALVFGVAGWVRTRTGVATNRGMAVTGAVAGLLALTLGVVATVVFVRAPDQLVYDLGALTSATATVLVVPA